MALRIYMYICICRIDMREVIRVNKKYTKKYNNNIKN